MVKNPTWETFLPKAGVVLILGHRGMGKSALAWWLLERLHGKRRGLGAVVVGLPKGRRRLVPEWVKHSETIARLPEKAAVLIDEAALRFSARRAMADLNLAMGALAALSRQRQQVIILVAHTARMLDVETVFDSDLVVYKMPSAAHVAFERRETMAYTQEARQALLGKKDPRRWAYAVDFHGGRKALLRNGLCSFWSQALSNAWAGLDLKSLAQTGKKNLKERR